MSALPAARPEPGAWIVLAHVLAGAALGLIEAARLGSASVGLVLGPVCAATGLVAGAVIAGTARLVRGRTPWVVALTLAAPSLIVTLPVGRTLFTGAYAQTLPGAVALPYVTPLVAWLLVAAATRLGGWLVAGDRVLRAIAALAIICAVGAIALVEQRLLGGGYPGARAGAALAVVVLAGALLRVAVRAHPSPYTATLVAAIAIGTVTAAATDGLVSAEDRRLVADRGAHGRELVRLWRRALDLDRDGSSALLGGGDCDDREGGRHPGALDVPGDGIDQDCDGADAVPPPPPPPSPPPAQVADFREAPVVRELLERARGMNVLLITVDALRADVLATGAADRDDFPHLAKLLNESVRFARAIAPGAGTDISISTLVTGRFDPFRAIEVTLPEAMQALGRRTASVLPREVTRYVGEVMLDRGIEERRRIQTDRARQDVGDHVSAGATTDEALRVIAELGEGPWYTWVHYFDVHEHHQIAVPVELLRAVRPGGSPKIHRYRALLRAIDGQVGRLLGDLEARGIADRTIVWFLSDHGESLEGDPRMPDTHGEVAYAPLVRVPLAVRIPGVPPAERLDPVSHVDVAPTMLALAGDAAAMGPLDGIDLVPAILGGPAALRPAPARALVVHEVQQWSVVEWPYQLIVRPADDLVELYDLDRDPLTRRDLAAQEPARVRRLRARYAEVPPVRIDRTAAGRAWREQRARRPPRPTRP